MENEREYEDLLTSLTRPRQPYVVSFVNAHAANLVWKAPEVFASLASSDLLLRDGIGVEIAMRAFGRQAGLNMNGTDLIPRIIGEYRGREVALFGTRSPWLDRARAKIEATGAKVIACRDGYAEPGTYVDIAARTQPDLIVLAMGMPKQESVAIALRDELSHPVLIVNGGAILDFLGDKVNRAPRLMRSAGMEWAFRLYLEPRRLAGRYVLGIPTFLGHVAQTRLTVPADA
ncbi:WecB/TagA/CpsF family glycosyltransferase [Gordonia sp. CPCC 205515]|uniref:WecB/TagA/CpsF family glycosyltransferase n=1 Tax=Gordonia sp. CPCC 205515 TaxID=3140791 RepID=UPI003AF3D2F9